MIISDVLQKKLKQLETMGLREAEAFRAEVVSSLLDTQTKCYCYGLIDDRVRNLNKSDAIANSEEDICISDFDEAER